MLIKQQIEQEAQSLALSLYNINLERDRIKKRLHELSVSMNTIGAVEKAQAEEASRDATTED